MNKYMLVFRGGAFATPDVSPTDLQNHLNKWREWTDGMKAKNQVADRGTPLQNGGRTLRGSDKTTTDGPYAESKDLLTGAIVVHAESLDAATEIARGCPNFLFGGSVEVRPLLDRG